MLRLSRSPCSQTVEKVSFVVTLTSLTQFFWFVFVIPQMLRMYMYCVSVKFKHLTDLQ